ncbi:hypothetical protein C8Q70DRAFT_544598 [Cubamyces menziesii]|nr:hypothetical protein C8Q70DRAFT_544598 [Cubamyces menziesii]
MLFFFLSFFSFFGGGGVLVDCSLGLSPMVQVGDVNRISTSSTLARGRLSLVGYSHSCYCLARMLITYTLSLPHGLLFRLPVCKRGIKLRWKLSHNVYNATRTY